MSAFGNRAIENVDTLTRIVSEQGSDAVFRAVFRQRTLADRPPKRLNNLARYLLSGLALGKLDTGDASIEVSMRRFFLDNAIEDEREHGMVRKSLHLSISLAGRHLVDRAESHVSSGEAAAEKVRDRGQQVCVRMVRRRDISMGLRLPVLGRFVTHRVQEPVNHLPMSNFLDAPALHEL